MDNSSSNSENPVDGSEKAARRRGRPSKEESVVSRDELLTEAFAQFATKGYDSVSLRKLASDIGVSDSLFHHYFGSKTELWREAVDKVLRPQTELLKSQLQTLSAEKNDPAAVLKSAIRAALHLAAENPVTMLMLFQENNTDTERGLYLYEEYITPYFDMVDAAFNAAGDSGQLKDVPLLSIHALITGAARILVEPGLVRARSTNDLEIEGGTQIFINGVIDILFGGMFK